MYRNLDEAVHDIFGQNAEIIQRRSISGGDINEAYHLMISGGREAFLKENSHGENGFFKAEADGLEALNKAGARVHKVLGWGKKEGDGVFLLMEYVSRSRPVKNYWTNLGYMLANVHSASTEEFTDGNKYGFFRDNFIGLTRQVNKTRNDWISFFRDERLGFQMKLADHYFDKEDRRICIYFLDHIEDYLTEPGFPSLLHGDLWSGNVMADENGEPMLIDPAAYVGHHEADIAMTELFGGFSHEFYDAYHEVIPKESGYVDRREIYNLYHLLNHLNLFGGSYLSAVRRILKKYGK